MARALTTVGVALARKPVVPSLGGVLLNGQNGRLTVSTADLDTVATARVPDSEVTPGRILIDHAETTKLPDALVKGRRKRDADGEPVMLRTVDDGTALIELGGYTVPVTTYPTEDFPTPPDIPPTVAEVNRETLTREAQRVLVATGTDETLPMFTAVSMQISPGTLTLAGTDRFRLAVAVLPATTPTEQRAVNFPARVLAATLKHLTAGRVRISSDQAGDWASLHSGDVTVMTRAITAPFPDYERLFPDVTATARADRDTLAQATARAAAVLDAKKRTAGNRRTMAQVAITIDPAGTVSVAPALGEQPDATTAPTHPAEVSGAREPMRVLFTAPYLRDALNAIDGGTLCLQLAGPTRPAMITGSHEHAYRHLLMPVRAPRP